MTPASDIATILEVWGGRPSVAVVDLDHLAANVQHLRRIVGARVRLMAVVKADGYGHGSVPIAKAAVLAGADELAVATVEEGVRLRRGGLRAPILVLGPVGSQERQRVISHALALVVADAGFARGLAQVARKTRLKQPLDVHLKVDTGMHRFGVDPEGAVGLARVVSELPELRLAGVMTHFASADDPDRCWTDAQARAFDDAVAAMQANGIPVMGQHLANSAATLRFPEYHRDRVRIGIAMYGLRPDADMPLPAPMRPVMTVHSRLARVLELEPGDRVSYGGTWVAEERCRIGLVPIGYADGYRRQGSNLAWMDVKGAKAPVRGRICMDQTLVEVGPDARAGDLVTVVGDGVSSVAPTIDDLAEMYGTVSHELPTQLVAPRLAHLYVQGGKLVAIADLWGYRELDPEALAQTEPEPEPVAERAVGIDTVVVCTIACGAAETRAAGRFLPAARVHPLSRVASVDGPLSVNLRMSPY